MNTTSAGIGHNNPPTAIEDLAHAAGPVLRELAKLRSEQEARIPKEFTSVDQAKKGISLSIMLGDLIDTVNLLVKSHRDPLMAMSKLMLANGQAWTQLPEEFRLLVRAKIDTFMDGMAEDEKIRTDYGELATRRHKLKFEVIEPENVPLRYCAPSDELIQDEIDKLVAGKPMAPGTMDFVCQTLAELIPGVRFYRENQLVLTQGKT